MFLFTCHSVSPDDKFDPDKRVLGVRGAGADGAAAAPSAHPPHHHHRHPPLTPPPPPPRVPNPIGKASNYNQLKPPWVRSRLPWLPWKRQSCQLQYHTHPPLNP